MTKQKKISEKKIAEKVVKKTSVKKTTTKKVAKKEVSPVTNKTIKISQKIVPIPVQIVQKLDISKDEFDRALARIKNGDAITEAINFELLDENVLWSGAVACSETKFYGHNLTQKDVFIESILRQAIEKGSKGVKNHKPQ